MQVLVNRMGAIERLAAPIYSEALKAAQVGDASLLRQLSESQRKAASQRQSDMSEARALIRKCQIRSAAELLALLQCATSAVVRPMLDSNLIEMSEAVVELCADWDARICEVEA